MNEENEIIFSARYSLCRVWGTIIVAILFPMLLLFSSGYSLVLKGSYGVAAGCFFLGTPFLLITLDSLLFKELIFYRDRVVKVWRLFGPRIIYYSEADVVDPPARYKYFLGGYQIREIRNGKALLIQMPIYYMAFFFSPEVRDGIGHIVDYLAGETGKNPRIFARSSLPKEVAWPE